MFKKIVALNSIPFIKSISNNKDEHIIVHVALCEDGSIYQIAGNDRGIAGDIKWIKLRPIPVDDI